MNIPKIGELCLPSKIYLGISVVVILIMLLQNSTNMNTYCLGNIHCGVTTIFFIYLFKIVYVLFWTWLLNVICKSGATWVSWILILLPFIFLAFIAMFLLFV